MKSQQIFRVNQGNNPFMGFMFSILLLGCLILSFFIGTEYIAFNKGYPGLYQPFSEVVWTFEAMTHGVKDEICLAGLRISVVAFVISFILLNVLNFYLRRRSKGTDIHGSAKWASEDDLKKMNLFDQEEGLYIGGWQNEKKGVVEYLKDNSEFHAIAIAPTGSGKGVGFVIPNLLSWTGSVIVFDLKGENYFYTSGYRKQELKQYVMAFNPTCADKIIEKEEMTQVGVDWTNFVNKVVQAGWGEQVDLNRVNLKEDLNEITDKLEEAFPSQHQQILSVLKGPHFGSCACYNPLNEVRMGNREVKDVQAIVEMLIDPFGKGELDHWHRSAKTLLTGIILHVLYARKDKTLSGVVDLLSDTKRPIYEVLESMLWTEHDPKGLYGWIDKSTGQLTKINQVIASVAREMKNKQFEELSGIVSTAIAFLTLYRDPIIAQNTSKSDFTISDIIKGDKPLSLYIIVPPSDLQRVVPLTRLLINQICARLMEDSRLGMRNNPAKEQRLLFMLDEFPALGKMETLKTALSFMRGYGLRAFLICQDLEQLNEIYGEKNSILGHCDIRIVYKPNTENTARKISALAGDATVPKFTHSYSGFIVEQVSEGASEMKRSLILPDEVLRLPETDMLIFIGKHPIYGKKVVYYKDPWFLKMSQIKPLAVSDRKLIKNDFSKITQVVEFKRLSIDDPEIRAILKKNDEEQKLLKVTKENINGPNPNELFQIKKAP